MKKTIFLFIIIFIGFVQITTAGADTFLQDAPAYILMDVKTGTVLSQKNADTKMFPASTTKILTAILAIEKGDMSKIATASREAVHDIGPGGMNIGIGAGEQLRLEDLLNAMLIKSANETANIVAETIAPTRKDFIDMMNARAKELGATNTHFTNPCGMHDKEHYTTSRDLALIARYALTLPKFREIVVKKSYVMSPTNKHEKWDTLYTTNRLLYYSSDSFKQITGVKSGYTSQAGYTLVSSAMNADGTELIAVIMGVRNPSKYKIAEDSKLLLEHGFKDFALQKLTSANQLVKSMFVGDAKEKVKLDFVAASDLSTILPKDKNAWNISTVQNIKSDIKLPVQKGDILGSIEYSRDGTLIGKVNIVAANSIRQDGTTKSKKPAKTKEGTSLIFTMFKLIIGIVLFFFALRFVLRTISRRLKAKRKRG